MGARGTDMRIVIALGGNALRRGEPLSAENQRENIRRACAQIAQIAPGNQLVVAHGNGPQVGLLALQAAYRTYPAIRWTSWGPKPRA